MKKSIITLAILAASVSVAGIAEAAAPQYPGGEEAVKAYLDANLVYPSDAADNLIEGVVDVIFTVKADGSVADAAVARPLDPDLEKEALRLVNAMPKWTPATDDAGNPIAQQVTLSVTFSLPE